MRKIESTYRDFRSDATKCEVALLMIKDEAQKDLIEGRKIDEQFALKFPFVCSYAYSIIDKI
jgi:hypothetical protein